MSGPFHTRESFSRLLREFSHCVQLLQHVHRGSKMWVTQLSHFSHGQWYEEPCSWSFIDWSRNVSSFILFSLQTLLLTVPDSPGARQRRERDPHDQVLLSPLPVLCQVAAGLPADGGRPGGEKLSVAQLGLPELPRCPQPAGEPRLLCRHQPQPVQQGSR